MTKRNLDGVYFRVMRDGSPVNMCWTDLDWQDKVDMMIKHNDESWLIRMIERMNDVAENINEVMPIAELHRVDFPTNGQLTMEWLRTALVRITADIRLAADEYGIMGEM